MTKAKEKARETFKKQWDMLPYNTLRAYVIVNCPSGCELIIPCRSREQNTLDATKEAFETIVEIAEY